MAKIPGGYYIKARCIQESEIAHATPCIRELWDWLIMQCNHSERRVNGTVIERGQCLRTIQNIRDGLSWKVGYRVERYTKSQVEYALGWLRRGGNPLREHDFTTKQHTNTPMIKTTKTTRGMVITVCKYDEYQNSNNYDYNNEQVSNATITKQSSDTINKNDKNDKNDTYVNTIKAKLKKALSYDATDKDVAYLLFGSKGKGRKVSVAELLKAVDRVSAQYEGDKDANRYALLCNGVQGVDPWALRVSAQEEQDKEDRLRNPYLRMKMPEDEGIAFNREKERQIRELAKHIGKGGEVTG